MPPFQQVILSNFCPARAALVNCKCCYCEVEISRSNNSSATKWLATQAHRAKPLKRIAWKNRLLLVAALTTEFQTASGSNVSTNTVCRELHEMGFHGRAAIGLWSSGNVFSGVMNHASPSVSLTDESGFGGCQNATCLNA